MKIREVASGLQFPEGPIAMDDGSVLLVEIARGTLSRVTPDGRIQVVAELGGGPNGAAIGPDGAVYVCNNGGFMWRTEWNLLRPAGPASDYTGGRIERVDPKTGKVLLSNFATIFALMYELGFKTAYYSNVRKPKKLGTDEEETEDDGCESGACRI